MVHNTLPGPLSSPLQSVNQWFITHYLGLCLLHCSQSVVHNRATLPGPLSSPLQSVNQWFITHCLGLCLLHCNQWFITCLFTPKCTAISQSVIHNMLPGPPIFSTAISQSVICNTLPGPPIFSTAISQSVVYNMLPWPLSSSLQSVSQWFITRYLGLRLLHCNQSISGSQHATWAFVFSTAISQLQWG